MSINVQPLADYVVAQQDAPESKTASGLYLPDNAQEKPKIAKILAIGKNIKNVKVGDRIIYKSYSSQDIELGDEKYTLVKEEDILATVK